MNEESKNNFRFVDCADRFPPFIPRADISKFFSWISPKTMANYDSTGKGPAEVIKVGQNTVVYPTPALLGWLDMRVNETSGHSEVVRSEEEPVVCNKKATRKTRNKCGPGRKPKAQQVAERREII